jgi:amino acid adenylation domain-containing protein
MVPPVFIRLDALPLTPNGKVDRRALPKLERVKDGLDELSATPGSPVEEMLTEIWAEVLGVDRVSINDNFFEVGGNSVLATQVVSRVRNAFNLELPLRTIFELPTAKGLARSIEMAWLSGQGLQSPPLEPLPRDRRLPLSFAQQRMWFLNQLEPESPSYNLPSSMRLLGELDVPALERTIAEIIRRHEILRTNFVTVDSQPVQVISPPGDFTLPIVDLRQVAPDRREALGRRLAVEESRRVFDLAHGPLIRARLLRLDREDHVILFNMHHIISDGWSLGVLAREVAALYDAFCQGRTSPLADLKIQYADFAAWQRQWLDGETLERQLTYWKEHLEGAPQEINLPIDRPRPPAQTYIGQTQSFGLSKEISDSLRRLSRSNGATLFMTLLAAFKVLLCRVSGQEEIVVGTPIANRNRAETEGLIGFFVNTLAMRADLSGDPTFKELLGQIQEVALGAYAHQDVPFEALVDALQPERHMSRSPIFQVMFVLQNAPFQSLSMTGLALAPVDVASGTSNFDLTLFISDMGEELSGAFEYSTDLFDPDTIKRLIGQFHTLLEAIASDPDQSIMTLPLLTREELKQILVEWNATDASYGREPILHRLFEEQAANSPDSIALVYESQRLTYHDLNAQANRLARHLRKMGVGPESLVGVCMERSVEMVVSLLGILKAGGAYVPLDPNYPARRLEYMINDAALSVLLTEERFLDNLPREAASVIAVDADWESLGGERPANLDCVVAPANACYVIYTSGSTGAPKAVVNTHEGICNRILWMQDEYRLTPSDRVLQKTPFTFDVSVWEYFWPLITGAQLVVARPGGHQDSRYLVDIIGEQQITTLHFVPSMLELFLQERDLEPCASVLRVMCSGEALSYRLQERFFARMPAALYNLYGPTEAAVDVTHWACKHRDNACNVPIGSPIANTTIYLLDPKMQPVPVGVAGELHIGGVGLARGYYGRPEMTAEKFVPDPFSGQAGARLYRTGDLARFLADGSIQFLGRIDHQVKIRGFRIELGEIESVLDRHPSISEAVVTAREVSPDGKRIVAYAVPTVGKEFSTVQLRDYLRQRLPDYMIPSAIVALDEMPRTASGKIDRRSLPAPDATRPELEEAFIAARTPLEEVLAGIWAEVLGLDAVGTRDNFFDLGGHSLLATQVMSRVRDVLDVEMPLRTFFEAPTISTLAEKVEAARKSDQGLHAPAILPAPRDEELLLSFAQQRLWFLDQLEPGSASYNLPTAVRLRGHLDLASLERALGEVVRRHEILRTTFKSVEGQPVQVIHTAEPVKLPVVDLQDRPESERESLAKELALEEARMPFDLASGPLLRVTLIALGPEDHVAVLNMHHIITDGWSMELFVKEVVVLYDSFTNDRPSPLPELGKQYADFAQWQRRWLQGAVLDAQLSYWVRALAGAPPVLQLPTDRPRQQAQTFRGATHAFTLDPILSDEIRALGRREGVTLFMTLLAAFDALLYGYSGEDDLVVGTNVANRNRSETDRLIGFFVNTLAIRADLSGSPTFKQLMAQVREATLGAYDHQDLPFERLVEELHPERQPGRLPLFQVMFVLQNAPAASVDLTGLTVRKMDIHSGASKFDLTLYIIESPREIAGMLEYNSDLFEAETVARMAEDFRRLLEEAMANPDADLDGLASLSKDDGLLVDDFNANLEAL